jgi:hypothetical protein
MNKLACFVLVIGTFAAPALSFAQSTTPLTRAQVRADLIRVEQAGYNLAAGDDPRYPADIQAAEAKVGAEQQQVAADVGGTPMSAMAASGTHTHAGGGTGAATSCSGPISFCTPYFGG